MQINMKKILIAAAALFVALSANAQVGIVAGLTSSSTDFKSAIADVKNVNQYHVGLTYKIGLGGLLAIQPSIIYNMKGQKIEYLSADNIQNTQIDKTGFLEVPVQVQVGIPLANLVRVYGFVEPFAGYALSNQVDINLGSASEVEKTWDNVKSKLEYGVGLGAGVEVFSHLQVYAKYFWNLGDVYSSSGSSTVNVGDAISTVQNTKCSGVAVSVAYLF